MNKKDVEMLVIGLGSGFLLGSVIATLFAPSSGKQLRMEMVDMVICHGGSQTVYQAIKAGIPCLVIATHLDQEWGGEEIEAHQAGIFLTMAKVMARPALIQDAARKMFEHMEEYKKNMKMLQEDLLKYDGLNDAVLSIEKFMRLGNVAAY